MRSALPLTTLTLAVVVLLTGCVPQDPDVVPPPASTTEPVFASDEEALAAATDAYKAYLAMSDLIAQEGGENPERIAPLVTEEWLEEELKAFDQLSEAGHSQAGSIGVSDFELQANQLGLDGSPNIGAYFCLDFSDVEVISNEGVNVTPTSRPAEVTVEVQFVGKLSGPVLLVERIEPWPASGIC